ncbi:MAG: pseudouridine synthase [Leptospira sp.]|nr:pseudouridine synthase [Leptospira sp.]
METERLDKVLSNLGIGSRSDVKIAIKQGKVLVNGILTKDPKTKVNLEDSVQYETEILIRRKFYYFMMNKAPDCITATEDPKEKTVMEYLSFRHQNMNLFPIGRLDKETEGLLLFTTNGPLAHKYTSPKHLVTKEYYAEIHGVVGKEEIDAFETGVTLDDGYKTLPAKLELDSINGDKSFVKVWLREGKYRQIRRMFVSLGMEVVYLKRVRMGAIELDPNLRVGNYRELTEEEIKQMEAL